MAVELIPAPGRQVKTWSTWLAIGTAVLAAVYASLPSFREYLSPETFAALMSGLALAIKIANLIKQDIPITKEQQDQLVSAALNAPVKEGEPK